MKTRFLPLILTLGALPASGAITANFNGDLSPDAQALATAAAPSLALNYTIDGSGNVSLVADVAGASPARWNQVSNASAGTVASAALYNKAFTLTYAGSAAAILNYTSTSTTGAVLATQQGNQLALENGEFIAFTVSGSATAVSGFTLDLTSFSSDLRLVNGGSSFGVHDTSGTVVQQLISNTSLFGTIDGTGISLAAGESMTFRTIAGNPGRAGLRGFTFEVSAVPEPSTALLGGLGILCLLLRRRA